MISVDRRKSSLLFKALWLLAIASNGRAAGPLFQKLDDITLSWPLGQATDLTLSPSGDIYVLDGRAWMVAHFSSQGTLLNQFAISGIPEAAQGRLSLEPEIAVDQSGNTYIPGIWRNAARQTFTGLFVFDESGRYTRTISTIPRVEARHLAMDRDGNFYVLGMDPDYFRWKADDCLLIHKYGPDGKRLTSFSTCPSDLILRTPQSAQPGPDFGRLNQEVNLGKVFVSADAIYHLLASSHVVRVFDLTGKPIRETLLEPATPAVTTLPDPTVAVVDNIRRVMPLPNAWFLAEWTHSEQSAGTQRSVRSLSVQDPAGKIVTSAVMPPAGATIVLAGENGICYMLQKQEPTGHLLNLVRVSVATQQ